MKKITYTLSVLGSGILGKKIDTRDLKATIKKDLGQWGYAIFTTSVFS